MAAWGTVWGTDGKLFQYSGNVKKNDVNLKSINMKKSDMKKLQVLQNSTLRLILKQNYDTPTTTLISTANVLSVNQLVAYNLLVQTYKIKETKQPTYHHQRLFGREENNQLGTRSMTGGDHRIEFRLSQTRCSFFYMASNLWNSIDPVMRATPKLSSFKTKIKKWVQMNIPMKI